MRQFDVTTAGDANLDLILYGVPDRLPLDRELLASHRGIGIGGSAAITAHNLAALGSRVGFITQGGDDIFSQFCLAELRSTGVDLSRVVSPRPAVGTGITVFLEHGAGRRALTYAGATSELRMCDLDLDYLAASRHFHLASLFLQHALRPDAPKLLAAMQRAGLTTSLDTNDDPADRWDHSLGQALAHVDIFLPNAREACRITRESDPESAALALARRIPTVVMKLGSQGALAIHEGRRYRIAALRVDTVDTVGAGDSFNAGFLHAWTRGANIEQCLQTANLCGAISTTSSGGTRAFLDPAMRAQLAEMLASGSSAVQTLPLPQDDLSPL